MQRDVKVKIRFAFLSKYMLLTLGDIALPYLL